MKMKQEKNIGEQYVDVIKKSVEAVQGSGDIPTSFVYSHNSNTWTLTLPQSVMAQKRLMHARNKFLLEDSYEAEEAFLTLVAKNALVNGSPVNLELLDLGELEVLKTAYLDSILLPLSLGGEKSLAAYMEAAVANIK